MFQQLVRSATFVVTKSSISFFVQGSAAATGFMAENHTKHSRLPRAIKPINYKLDFIPNFTNFTFTADASVELQVVEPTNRIIFNSKGLEISSVSYQDTPATIAYDDEQETVTFEFPTGLQSGVGQLNLKFSGKFANDMLGLYRSTYTDKRGKESNILATQFEAALEKVLVSFSRFMLVGRFRAWMNRNTKRLLTSASLVLTTKLLSRTWETALLIDPDNSSLLSKQYVALTVAHELAHMWFGNLVTMSWWTDLWLKEGFATWAEYLAVDHCFPDYDIWTLFVSREYIRALRLDELKSSHPIEVEVNSAQEVEEIFDEVSYQKGSCVIRMLHNHMGACLFQEGLKAYFEKFKYSNAKTEDLWTALETTGIDNVAELMSLWTKQTGYPVISVRLLRARDGTYSIGLRQQRFLADGSSAKGDSPVHWRIPINVCTVDDSNKLLLRKVTSIPSSSTSSSFPTKTPDHGDKDHSAAETEAESQEIIYALPDFTDSSRVRLNPDAIGFYRVHYDPPMFSAILEAIGRGTVSERDRISLLDDQFALARAGFQGLDRVLQFCRAFVGETRYSVWSVLSEGLAQVRTLLEEASYPAGDDVIFPEASKEICGLNKLYIELALPVYEKIGVTSTDDWMKSSRGVKDYRLSQRDGWGSASDFASQARYDEIKAFYEEHEVPCLRVIQQTLESVKINVEQWKRDEKAVGKFLRKLVC
ncbi:Puromycin-sensitive aminopeptidase [Echinococcus granulosus]|uniref:Puromycin-sensitive aminopeptidase n=1 Tax=Echinococcus granulosus TaxID=6210 RepID=W6U017_ECHGR|nr:Puromycin-sensitive aminopeptidase [Echinococcus granulosus]EUB54430.1 Puromycin-sensitive aminopeptidase [Echinococcus granulosus]